MSLDLNESNTFTHETVPTAFIDVKGTKFAYRSFGQSEGVPVVFLQHFTGTLDNWDPALTNELAKYTPSYYLITKVSATVKAKPPLP